MRERGEKEGAQELDKEGNGRHYGVAYTGAHLTTGRIWGGNDDQLHPGVPVVLSVTEQGENKTAKTYRTLRALSRHT